MVRLDIPSIRCCSRKLILFVYNRWSSSLVIFRFWGLSHSANWWSAIWVTGINPLWRKISFRRNISLRRNTSFRNTSFRNTSFRNTTFRDTSIRNTSFRRNISRLRIPSSSRIPSWYGCLELVSEVCLLVVSFNDFTSKFLRNFNWKYWLNYLLASLLKLDEQLTLDALSWTT